jgi:hypothetical protein
MQSYFIVIIAINLAGTILLVGLVTWQGILITWLQEQAGILYENDKALAEAHNGVIGYLRMQYED